MVLARNQLWYLVFSGVAIVYMTRVNINIAILSMVLPAACRRNKTMVGCSTRNSNITASSLNVFEWDEYEQSLILGAYFWGQCCTLMSGGFLCRKFGVKAVFGLTNILSGLLSILIPYLSTWSYEYIVFLRFVQGLLGGPQFPALNHLTAFWIPPNERSKYTSSFTGGSIGTALSYPFFGFINDSLGWEYAFYSSGVISCIWYACWLYFMYDTPNKHPWISPKEKEYIRTSLGDSAPKEKIPVPWKNILLSRPVYLLTIVMISATWSLFTLMTQAPTYFKYIHGLSNTVTGLLSGLPHILRSLFSLILSYFADTILRKNIMSRTNLRKLTSSILTFGQGIFIVGLAYSGHNSTVALINYCLAMAIQGAVSAGPLASIPDLSPNFASVVCGMVGLCSQLPNLMSPVLIGILTLNNQTPEQWTKVFLIMAFMLFVSGALYLLFGNSELQSWNNPPAQYELVKKKQRKNQHDVKSIN